jgi:hypothetical protein
MNRAATSVDPSRGSVDRSCFAVNSTGEGGSYHHPIAADNTINIAEKTNAALAILFECSAAAADRSPAFVVRRAMFLSKLLMPIIPLAVNPCCGGAARSSGGQVCRRRVPVCGFGLRACGARSKITSRGPWLFRVPGNVSELRGMHPGRGFLGCPLCLLPVKSALPCRGYTLFLAKWLS